MGGRKSYGDILTVVPSSCSLIDRQESIEGHLTNTHWSCDGPGKNLLTSCGSRFTASNSSR